MAGRISLSNRFGLINLGRRRAGFWACRESQPDDVCVLGLRACGEPVADPYSRLPVQREGSVRKGAAIWLRARASCLTPGRRPVFRGDFEYLCHAAIEFQT